MEIRNLIGQFEELGMDTADIDTEIADLKLKVVSTQARIKELEG